MNNLELNEWLSRPDVQERLKPVKELQGVLLELLRTFDALCAKYNLRYYLFYGTLLGAIRHKGFVPWDDDADVVMPREDYAKLIALSKEVVPRGFFLQTPWSEKDGRFAFAKFRKDGTACICPEHRHVKMHQGIFIDIFPMDEPIAGLSGLMWTVPRFFERLVAFTSARLPRRIRFLRPVQWCWQKIFSASFFARIADRAATLLNGRCGCYMCTFTTERYDFERKMWDKSWFDPPMRVPFDGLSLMVPREYEKVLEKNYGDWRTPPPVASQIPIHSAGGILDTKKDYKEYINGSEGMKND